MEKYTRKILSNRVITSIDTDGDGQDDAITLMPLTPVNIQFFLKENVDNMGLFTDFVEEVEIIDIDNIWDLDNDGSGDGVTTSGLPDLTNPYDDDTISTTGGALPAYCTDPDATNYYGTFLTSTQITALGQPYDPNTNPSGTWVVGSCNFDTGIDVGDGVSTTPDFILWTGTTGTEYIIRNYRADTAQSCYNKWGGHDFLPADCGGSPSIQSQCGYPQALNFARQFCYESTEDGAAIGEWSLLEFTNESNISYNPTGQVQADMTDTAPLPITNTPFPTTLSTIYGGPAFYKTNEEKKAICWNDMTNGFQIYIQGRIGNGVYNSGHGVELEVGDCNNCDDTYPYQYGRCKHDTSAKQTIVNGLSFRWLKYDHGGGGDGTACGSSKLDCYADVYPGVSPYNILFNNINDVWDFGPLDLKSDTINNCGHEKRNIYFTTNMGGTSDPLLIPRIAAKTYTHNYTFNCKKPN